MQELRSTDILDKEILSESRKKAEKILKNADADCKELLDSLDSEIQKARAEKQKFYDEKLKLFEKNKKVSIPLEKQRFKITFIENAVLQNINEYLKSVDDDKKIKMLVSRLQDCEVLQKSTDGQKFTAFIYGFDEDKVKAQLSKKIGKLLDKCEKTEFGKVAYETDFGFENPQGIILETENKSIRVRLTFSQVLEQILDKNREELTSTLFGGDL